MSLFKSNSGEFFRKNEQLKDIIQGSMAQDIETAIKMTAGTPVKTGNMKSMVRSFKNREGRWRVEANAKYSAYQERGARADGSHRVRRYSTPGTRAGWFKRSIDGVLRNRSSYIMKGRSALGL